MLTFFPFEGLLAECPCDNGLVKQVNQIMRPTQQVMSQDIGKFCRDNVINGMAPEFGLKITPEADNTVALQKFGSSGASAWWRSILPFEALRHTNLEHNEFLDGLGIKSYGQLRSVLAKKELAPSPTLTSFGTASFDKIEAGEIVQSKDYSINGLERVGICSTLTFSAISCSKGLKKIMEIMTPRHFGTYTYSLVPLYKEVFTDSKYVEGARLAAAKILSRVESGAPNKDSNLYDDIFESYKESGCSEAEAKDRTWNIIGLLSTAGPNIGAYVGYLKVPPEFSMLKIALNAIASATPVLDARTSSSGHIYSYPRSVTSTCDTGKMYHFWMTAFLSRKLTKEFGSTKGAAAAAFLAQKGYEMKSRTAGRDPERAFKVDTFDPVNNLMRMDMAYSSAGAVYGANSAEGHESDLDVDAGLKTLINSAQLMPKLSDKDAADEWSGYGITGYFRWQKVFAPDSAYDLQSKFLK